MAAGPVDKGSRITQAVPVSGTRNRNEPEHHLRVTPRAGNPAKSFQNGKAQTRPR